MTKCDLLVNHICPQLKLATISLPSVQVSNKHVCQVTIRATSRVRQGHNKHPLPCNQLIIPFCQGQGGG